MTGTLGANVVWDWMPFMAGLNGEEGPSCPQESGTWS